MGAAGPARGNGETRGAEEAPRDVSEPQAAVPPDQPAACYLDLWEAQLAAAAAEGSQRSAGGRASRRPA